MADINERIRQEVDELRTRRDELRVQLDLGKKDVEDAWEDLEKRWHKLEAHVGRLTREGSDALEDVGEAAELLVSEIKAGLKRVAGML